MLLDARKPFGNGWVLPAGPLREKAREIKRADIILLTHTENQEMIRAANSMVSMFTSAPTYSSFHKPTALHGMDNSTDDPNVLNGKRITAFCGIANPTSFDNTLQKLGTNIVDFLVFPDHHYYNHTDINRIINRALKHKAEFIVTTEKDWIKLPKQSTEGVPMKYLTIELVVNESKSFFNFLNKIIKV